MLARVIRDEGLPGIIGGGMESQWRVIGDVGDDETKETTLHNVIISS